MMLFNRRQATALLLTAPTMNAIAASRVQHPSWSRQVAIYEVNVRQFTPEGTLAAFETHLPRLQQMGVGLLWFMPVQPIGLKHRKGGMGSYYSIRDYTAVNPEFGSLADFRRVVAQAHALGMKVILDWVANHTAWDHPWVTQHPERYRKDAQGRIHAYTYRATPASEPEYWTDVVGLDYREPGLWPAMTEAMQFWLREADIDGFRCDVASLVPTPFWEQARAALDRIKPVFMLAESAEPELHAAAFDMTYDWDLFDQLKKIAKEGSGQSGAAELQAWWQRRQASYPADAYRMNFTANHDSNSWHGTDVRFFGPAFQAMAVLAATLPGMPLVYGGQEAVLDRRLAFFEKDPIAWKDLPLQAFYTRLLQLKQREAALANGDAGGALEWLDLGNPALLAFRREHGASRVSVTVNLSAQPQGSGDHQLPPWGWHIQTGADDPWRPRFHFSAAKNWINDPNGLIFVDGEYHLFYQYNPFGDQWGHMSWGHAVSRDLMQWQELPVAIPEDERVSIFSGSVVIDEHNSSGFGDGRTPPLVAIYTGCLRRLEGGQAQELAWSTDSGRTWTKYAGNPVLDRGLRDFRDPKVFWHAGTARWIMLVSVPDERRLAFYNSVDLKAWTLLSHFDAGLAGQGIWECPDLFELPVDGEAPVWVLKVDVFEGHPSQGSGARLFLGRFDGRQFTLMPQDRPLWADHGADFYAALSWANLGRRAVWIGWMNCHRYAKLLPTQPWRGAMSVPRDLSLKRRPVGLALCQWPVPELTAWHGATARHAVLDVASTAALLPPTMDGRALDIEFMVSHSDAQAFGLRLRAGDDESTLIGYDRRQGVVFVDRTRSGFSPAGDPHYAGRREAACPGPAPGRPLRLRVLVDHCSVELFVGEGEIVITEQILPRDDSRGLLAWSDGGRTRFEDVRIAEIQRPSSTRP